MMQGVPALIIPGSDTRILIFQAGIGFTYSLAMFGVTWLFRRPWVRYTAIVWTIWWVAYLLAVPFVEQGVAAPPEILLGAVLGPLPLLRWSVSDMGGANSAPRPSIWPMVRNGTAWSIGAWLVVSLLSRVQPEGPVLALLARRVLIAFGFLAAAWLVARRGHAIPSSRLPAFLMAWSLLLFGVRVLAVGAMVFFAESTPTSSSLASVASALIVAQTTASGLLILLATTIGERRSLIAQQHRAMEAERQAAHADRLESLGRLAGGVAHDFNNVLMAVDSCADLAMTAAHDPVAVREELDVLRRASTRGRELTRQLLAYARRDMPVVTSFAPDDRLRSVIGMLRRLVSQDVRLTLDLGDDIACVSMDASQFEQVVMNLVLNARDAMPGVGAITVSLRTVHVAAQLPTSTGIVSPGRHVLLSVKDDGTGISADRLDRIFDPFYSTKGPDRGTGLGLATVQAIVSRAGGGIHADSVPGAGSTFSVYLPAPDESPSSHVAARQDRRPAMSASTSISIPPQP